MNNKLWARIFAVVMVVAMLGTVSFAATSVNEAGTAITVDQTEVGEDVTAQATKTVLAFYAAETGATSPAAVSDVVALIQTDDADDFTTINIDAEKVTAAEKNFLVLNFGGTAGVTKRIELDLTTSEEPEDPEEPEVPETEVKSVTLVKEITIGDVTYTDAVLANCEFTASTGKTVAKYGVKFYQEGREANSNAVIEFANPTNVTGTAVVEVSAFIYGIPATKDFDGDGEEEVVNILATPFIEYAE